MDLRLRAADAGGGTVTSHAPGAPSSSDAQGGRRFTWIGLLIVAAAAAVSAAILVSQREAGLARPATARVDARSNSNGDARFRADAWGLPADDLLGFVSVPAGTLTMGNDRTTDPLAFDNERWSPAQAQGSVEVPEFFLARHEVTVAQYLAFASATGHPVDPGLGSGRDARRGSHPVAFVSWPDALAYCRWLTATLAAWPNTPPALRDRLREGWRITLPSEAQWERAARADDGRRYPWGHDMRPDRANVGTPDSVPVGSLDCRDCAFGLSDMSGNVWEWTRSPYQAYPFDPSDDGRTAGADALWVMRGGSFADNPQTVRGATRGGADPGVRRATIGFRVALSKE